MFYNTKYISINLRQKQSKHTYPINSDMICNTEKGIHNLLQMHLNKLQKFTRSHIKYKNKPLERVLDPQGTRQGFHLSIDQFGFDIK